MEYNHMEIERKWMVSGFPEESGITLPLLKVEKMEQGYLSVEPTVRIRKEDNVTEGHCAYILCFKKGRGLSRQELEFPIETDKFESLKEMIGAPLIPKVRKSYQLQNGLVLEVSRVDDGTPTAFSYAEIEYPSEDAANAYDPRTDHLERYLTDAVTGLPGQSMGAYWIQTRLPQGEEGGGK